MVKSKQIRPYIASSDPKVRRPKTITF